MIIVLLEQAECDSLHKSYIVMVKFNDFDSYFYKPETRLNRKMKSFAAIRNFNNSRPFPSIYGITTEVVRLH
jgi:hypothetical protein